MTVYVKACSALIGLVYEVQSRVRLEHASAPRQHVDADVPQPDDAGRADPAIPEAAVVSVASRVQAGAPWTRLSTE